LPSAAGVASGIALNVWAGLFPRRGSVPVVLSHLPGFLLPARRKIFDSRDIEPAQADEALHAIAALYKVEKEIRDDGLTGQTKLSRGQEESQPVLGRFFVWIDEQFDKQRFLPSSPFLGALAYIRERRVGLSVYLDERVATSRSAPGVIGASVHVAHLEGDVFCQSATIGSA